MTDILAAYALGRSEQLAAPERLGYAIEALTGYWQGRTVADVTPLTCAAYVRHRAMRPAKGERPARALSAGTARRELGTLRAAINFAHRCGRLTRTVAVELPERPPSRDRWLTHKEAAALLRAARTPQARLYLPLFILIGLYTGRRKEAILSLRWPQVDLTGGTIDFDGTGRRTKKRRGKVRIPKRLLPHLRRAQRRGAELGYVLHENGARLGDIKKGFAGAVRRAGLANVTPHTLRHTAATWLLQEGKDPWRVSGFLAMSLQTLLDTYGHHSPDHMGGVADAIGRRPPNVRVIARGS